MQKLLLTLALILLSACAAQKPTTVKPAPAPAAVVEQSAYLLVQASVSDRAKFGGYIGALPPVYAKFGGAYLAVAPAVTVERLASPGATQSIVISRWPSLARVQEFWNSPEYREVKKLRDGTGAFSVVAFAASGPDLEFSGSTPPGILITQGQLDLSLQPQFNALLSGAQVLAQPQAQQVLVLEGNAPASALTLSRWPDKAAARSAWTASAWAAALREQTAPLQVDLIDGLPPSN